MLETNGSLHLGNKSGHIDPKIDILVFWGRGGRGNTVLVAHIVCMGPPQIPLWGVEMYFLKRILC